MGDKRTFSTVFQELMELGGFDTFTVYTSSPDDPDALVEAVVMARSNEAARAMSLAILTEKEKQAH